MRRIAAFMPLVLCGLLACTEADRPAPKPAAHATPKKPMARLVVIADLQGYLEPCGCQARPLGGIDRATAKLSALRAEGVPMAVVSAGDLMFEAGDAHRRSDDKARTQEVWKAQTMVQILNDVPLALAMPGPGDLRFGPETFAMVAKAARFPMLGTDAGGRPRPEHDLKVLEIGGVKVAVFGLTAVDEPATQDASAAALSRVATQRIVAARAAGARVTVAMLQAKARVARRMAGATAALDFVILAGREEDDARPPSRLGDTQILTSARHGRGLLVVDLFVDRQGPFTDASEWTRAAKRVADQRVLADLEARIAVWEKDPKVDPAQLAAQRKRVARLRQQAGEGAPTAVKTRGNAFSARLQELGPEAPKSPATTRVLADYDRRVNAHNKEAFADWKPEPPAEGQPAYVGSATCNGCHAAAYAWWQDHPHGKAYTTLTERSKEFNLSCVGCHVTGYLQPGGSTVTHNQGLTHVGCEACHGPASLHLADPENIVAAPEEATCVGCHNEEHSAEFEFDPYRTRLIVPGHGLPVPTPAGTPATSTP